MITTITGSAKETISRLIRNEFDNIDFSMDFIYGKSKELISATKSYGLDHLAEEMENDLNAWA